MSDLGGIDSSKIIVIDTETTGIRPGNDEVLSLSVTDGDGNTLFYDFVHPEHRKRWPKAAEVNGITWNDVKDKPTLAERRAEIMPLFENAEVVVGYNVDFDLKMLEASGLEFGKLNTFDVMKEYASFMHSRYIKLTECAEHYGYNFTPHEAQADTLATLHCFKCLVSDDEYIKHRKSSLSYAAAQNPATMHGSPAIPEEELKKRQRSNRLFVAAGIALVILSLVLFLNSCTINGGAVGGTLLTMLLSIVMFVVGVFLWMWGKA